jgi:DNA gyrase/topoisomerase IV subunit B
LSGNTAPIYLAAAGARFLRGGQQGTIEVTNRLEECRVRYGGMIGGPQETEKRSRSLSGTVVDNRIEETLNGQMYYE